MKNLIKWKQNLSKCKVFLLGLVLLTVSFPDGALAQPDEPVLITAENADQLEELYSWQAYDSAVARLGFMPDSTTIISSGEQPIDTNPVTFWSLQDGQVENKDIYFEGLAELPSGEGFQFTADGQRMLMISSAAFIWDTNTGDLIGRILQWTPGSAIFGIDKQHVLVANGKTLAQWGIHAGLPSTTEMPMPDIPFDPDGALITAVEMDEPVRSMVYDLEGSQAFVLSAYGNLYSYTSPNYQNMVTPLPLGIEPSSSESPELVAGPLVMNTTNHTLAFTGPDRTAVIYDYRNHEVLGSYPMESPILCLMYSENGMLIVAEFTLEASLHLIDTTAGKEIGSIEIPGDYLTFCALSPDGKLIALGQGNRISVWGVS